MESGIFGVAMARARMTFKKIRQKVGAEAIADKFILATSAVYLLLDPLPLGSIARDGSAGRCRDGHPDQAEDDPEAKQFITNHLVPPTPGGMDCCGLDLNRSVPVATNRFVPNRVIPSKIPMSFVEVLSFMTIVRDKSPGVA